MTSTIEMKTSTWTTQRAIIVASVALMLGIVSGYFIGGVKGRRGALPAPTATTATNTAGLKQQADAQAAALAAKLKADPNSTETLISLGNIYYDAQQYAPAVEYYGRALAITPSDVSVRTDMGTAYYFQGNADAAISEFDKALTYDANSANTLFNRGLVEWAGKHNGTAALNDWNKLLATNPNYEQKEKVQQMIAEVQKATGK